MKGRTSKYSHFIEEPILTIVIRPDVAVRIHGIPWNMTKAEAEKVAQIVLAHTRSHEEGDTA